MAIKKLDSIIVSRIAAGEVVERPSSVLRELLDNSLDAKATKISVYIEMGGIKSLTVIDNGTGISKEDLPLACVSHATSKISNLEDLFNLRTLGFRGEALNSIASCSVLTIDSNGNKIVVDNGVQSSLLAGSVYKGTLVCMENLFEMIPARKLFLRRPQSEATDCRKIFLEKALGFEDVEFLFFVDGELKLHLTRASKRQRVVDVMALDKAFAPSQVLEMDYESDNVKLYAVATDPSCYKRDRSQIKVFVNGRIIDNYALVQAINSAYSVSLPGGAFPFFYLFIDDNPSLVDFNIHPAKRECKIRNQSQIYASITSMIRNALLHGQLSNKIGPKEDVSKELHEKLLYEDLSPVQSPQDEAKELPQKPYSVDYSSNNKSFSNFGDKSKGLHSTDKTLKTSNAVPFNPSWFENARAIMSESSAKANVKASESVSVANNSKEQELTQIENAKIKNAKIENDEKPYKYIGQLFNTFLLVEVNDKLLFIDQHAAHERLLYDEILSQKDVQRLIVPYQFETDRSADDFLLENSIIYSNFGVELTRVEPMLWEMSTIPAVCRKNEASIASYIQNTTGDIESARKGLFAIMACHAAIKAGDPLDFVTAKSLVDKVFTLDAMVCPHGRSFTFEITREELYKKVGRII